MFEDTELPELPQQRQVLEIITIFYESSFHCNTYTLGLRLLLDPVIQAIERLELEDGLW